MQNYKRAFSRWFAPGNLTQELFFLQEKSERIGMTTTMREFFYKVKFKLKVEFGTRPADQIIFRASTFTALYTLFSGWYSCTFLKSINLVFKWKFASTKHIIIYKFIYFDFFDKFIILINFFSISRKSSFFIQQNPNISKNGPKIRREKK